MIVSEVRKHDDVTSKPRRLPRRHARHRSHRCESGNGLFQLNMLRTRRGTDNRPFVLVRDMAREFARQFYSGKAWQDCRDGYKAYRGHLCEDCLKRGIYNPGVIVHHVEELTPYNIENPEVSLNWGNLRLVCRECHIKAHDNRLKDRRYTVDPDGKVIVNELI